MADIGIVILLIAGDYYMSGGEGRGEARQEADGLNCLASCNNQR